MCKIVILLLVQYNKTTIVKCIVVIKLVSQQAISEQHINGLPESVFYQPGTIYQYIRRPMN